MRYRSKPQEIEAVQWTGDSPDNVEEVVLFGDGKVKWFPEVGMLQMLAGKDGAQGWVPVPGGHWIVHMPDDKSDMWPVDPDYFAAKYEPLGADL